MKEVFKVPYPENLPSGWKLLPDHLFKIMGVPRDLYLAYMRKDGLTVTMTFQREQDKRRWFHVSISRPKKEPSYYDLCEVKKLFLGKDAMAYLLFVPEAEHINIHPHCLHLWSCPDERLTPDFTWGTGSI